MCTSPLARKLPLALAALLLLGTGCLCRGALDRPLLPKLANLQVTSPAFREGALIPSLYTADGKDISPPLAWKGVPRGAKSLALVMEDPDAPRGTFVHWLVWNLPAGQPALPAAVPRQARLASGARQGYNDFGKVGYWGPAPPRGTHRYFFRLYALDVTLSLPPQASKAELLRAMQGHLLAQGSLMGRYRRGD